MSSRRVALSFLLVGCSAFAQTVDIDSFVVTAFRASTPRANIPSTEVVLDQERIQKSPAMTMDGMLRSVVGFSLFRRTDSLIANPTSQGVSLRGLGPSGASRTLVLLDGIPLNDPFGGWVTWSKLPRLSLQQIEILKGGGATAWGNAALGGVIQFVTTPILGQTTGGFAEAGDFATRSLEVTTTQTVGATSLRLSGKEFTTDGFETISPENRGPIDINLASRHKWLTAELKTRTSAGLDVAIHTRVFDESRNNGTPYQHNRSTETSASVSLSQQISENLRWNGDAFVQGNGFSSTFSSVNPTRTTETPASDQFDVPASTAGMDWTASLKESDKANLIGGVDMRTLHGETRENFSYVNGAFTRQRFAGGKQSFTGLYAQQEIQLPENLRATLGLRGDEWNDSQGHRREVDRSNGSLLRNDFYSAKNDLEFSPSVGVIWSPSTSFRLRSSAQRSFRRPTLNELYRPFRQGSDITEANADLKTEHVHSAEIATDLSLGPVRYSVAGFWNRLDNSVANVTLAHGPGNFPLFGTIGSGGTGRQRLNLNDVVVKGIECSAAWEASRQLEIRTSAIYDDARVSRADVSPNLEGKRLAEVPKYSASVEARWKASKRITLTPRLRWSGRQFDDDENQRELGKTVIEDLRADFEFSAHLEVFASTENLFNERIETAKTADGSTSLGTPRFVRLGISGSF